MIPKKIHYCWFGGKPFSPLVTMCMDSWKQTLPEYEIKRWDEGNLLPLEKCLYARHAYENKKWAFVADYMRLYALYHEGGIYMDTDMLVLKSFDPLLSHDCFLGREGPGSVNFAIAGALPQHPFMHKLLQEYELFEASHYTQIPRVCTDALRLCGGLDI